jgi:hypothetical protein
VPQSVDGLPDMWLFVLLENHGLLLQPEFWLKTGIGGWTEDGNWVPGFEGYAPYFHRVANALNPCDDPEGPQLSGPGWGECVLWFEGVGSGSRAWQAVQQHGNKPAGHLHHCDGPTSTS